MNNDFDAFHFGKYPNNLLNESWLVNIWYPPLKQYKNHVYLFTFNAASSRVLSWLTDDTCSYPRLIEKQPSEEMMVKVHFAEWHNYQLCSQAAIPLIKYHHRSSWFTHREKSTFKVIQNFCKGNTKHAGILLSHCPSSYGVKKIYWYKVEAIYLIKEIKIKLVKKCFSKETFNLFTSLPLD